MKPFSFFLVTIILLSSSTDNLAQNAKVRIGSTFMYSSYFNSAQNSLNGYFENTSNSGFDGEFYARIKLSNERDIQVGLGTLRRLSNFSDLSTGKEIHLVSREDFFSFPIIQYRKFEIVTNQLEFNCGSGLSFSVLNSQDFFSREGILPLGYEAKSLGFTKKLAGLMDFNFYLRPNQKYNLFILLGNRFSADLWDLQKKNYYISYSGYVGISYCFNKILF